MRFRRAALHGRRGVDAVSGHPACVKQGERHQPDAWYQRNVSLGVLCSQAWNDPVEDDVAFVLRDVRAAKLFQ